MLYTVYEAHWGLRRDSDFYQQLGLAHSASEREIKSRFRRLAALYHPDKILQTPGSDVLFRNLKTAQDILLNPAARFAYDRFGFRSATWQNCSTVQDYVSFGITQNVISYAVVSVLLYFLSLFGILDWGRYWRWLILVSLAVFECYVVSRPYKPWAVRALNSFLTILGQPAYLPFQLIEMLHQCMTALFLAFSQIGPLLEDPNESSKAEDSEEMLQLQTERVSKIALVANTEATRMMGLEMAPFVGDKEAIANVQSKVKHWLVQNTIKADPMVRDALGNVMKKRRTDAPAGGRGNR